MIDENLIERLFVAICEAELNAETLMNSLRDPEGGPDSFDKENDCVFMMYVKERNELTELRKLIGAERTL